MKFLLCFALSVAPLIFSPAANASAGWDWPVRGPVLTEYSNDNSQPYAGGMHRGVDIAAPIGTKVGAAYAGSVSYAGNLGSSGLTVAVTTSNGGYVTSYLHLSQLSVARGAQVGFGDRIGAVGTTGERSAQEPHLHFGVRLADRESFYVDPLTLLPPLTSKGEAPLPVTTTVPAAVPARTRAEPVRAAQPADLGSPVARRAPVRSPRAARRPASLPRPGAAAARAPAALTQRGGVPRHAPADAHPAPSSRLGRPARAAGHHPPLATPAPIEAAHSPDRRPIWIAVAALALLAAFGPVAVRVLRGHIVTPLWATTSRRRSTTSTRSHTSATPTPRSPPTSSPDTCASVARMSFS